MDAFVPFRPYSRANLRLLAGLAWLGAGFGRGLRAEELSQIVPGNAEASPNAGLFGMTLVLAGILGVTVALAWKWRKQRDATKEQLAQTSAKLKRLVQAVDSASDAIGIGDMEANSLFHNKAHIELFGYSVADLNSVEEPAALFADKRVAMEIHQSIRRGVSWHGETEIKAKDGRVFPALVRADIIRDDSGLAVGIFGVFTDITERRRQEDAIRASQVELRQSNESLARAVEEAQRSAREAEAANQAKGAFLATMSHEIRTPLNGVIGMTQMLDGTPLSTEQMEYLRTIKLSSEALLIIINDTLDYSKIEAGKVELAAQPFDLWNAVRDSFDLIAARARAKGLRFEQRIDAEVPRGVVGDAARLRQILINLLNNAVKFTERGEVVLEVVSTMVSEKRVRLSLSVRDTGIGIPLEKQSLLFQRFSQVDGTNTRRYGGTGLGLAISKRLAELMGGGIELESQEGQGSTFTLVFETELASELPCSRAPFQPLTPAKPAGNAAVGAKSSTPSLPVLAASMPMRILVTDDNPVNRKVAQLTLKKFGYEAALACDGREAVQAQREHSYDVILMDVQMPEVDGLEATRQIRAEPVNAVRPWIIALTAGAFEEDRVKALAAGMSDFLNKPLRAEQLHESLQRAHGTLFPYGKR